MVVWKVNMLVFVFMFLVASFGFKDYVTCYNVEMYYQERMEKLEEILNKFEEEYGIDILDNNIKENITNEIEEDLEETRMMFPGTKWCGPGNTARGPNDLGFFRNVDNCCRQHDQCPDYIAAGETKFGLTNSGRYTRLSCSCDLTLYNCLKGFNTAIANKVGGGYFNLINTQCFKEDFPIIQCLQYSHRLNERCLIYQQDQTKPKIYQWFDEPVY